MLVKFVTILNSPPIEVIHVVAEDSEHNLIFHFLIIVRNTLCGCSNQLDIDQRTVEHLVYIVDVVAEVKELKSVDKVDPANDLILIKKHLHRKLS